MARQKLPEDKKKPKICITINMVLDEIMETHLTDIGVNHSKYIEKLIRKDMVKRGKNINPDFEI